MLRTVLLYTFVLISCYWLADRAEKLNKTRNVILVIILLTLLAGLRSDKVGSDSFMYARQFMLGSNGTINFEIGFKTVYRYLYMIGHYYTFAFFPIAAIINSLIIFRLWTLRKIAPFKYTFFIFYCWLYFYTFSGIRQWLAVSIVFAATYFLFEKNSILKYLIFVGIAFFIHTSALISIILLIPAIMKVNTKSAIQQIEKGAVILFFPVVAITVFSMIMTRYGSFLSEFRIENSIGLMVPFRAAILTLILVNGRKRTKCDIDEKMGITFAALVFCEICVLATSSLGYFWNNVSRIGWYFSCVSTVLNGYVLSSKYRLNSTNNVVKGMVVVFALYTYITTLRSFSTSIVPYYFFWEI